MKTLTMRWMIAVAALAVAAGSASAQTYKAEIPMPFHAGDKLMAAGSYAFDVAGGPSDHFIVVRNLENKTGTMLLPGAGSDAPKAWRDAANPVISFKCYGSTCALNRIFTAQNSSTYTFHSKELPTVEARNMTAVTVALIKVR